MEEKEKKELVNKILNVDNDAKMARVAMTVFVNKSTPEEALFWLEYLEHSNSAVKKLVRSIVGQKGLPEAAPILMSEFESVVDNLTFLPDAEYKENYYYSNMIEILETLFNIAKVEKIENVSFFNRIDEVFKKTKNEDLRFSLIKLISIMGDRFEYFTEIFDDLTQKERRALYYVYVYVDSPKRLDMYKKGLEDDRNFEYVISNMLQFEDGRKALADQILNLGNYNKQTVLKKLQQGSYPEFNDVLIKLLSDKNKFLVELSIEILKNNVSSDFSLEPFIQLVETGYSPEGIQGALEIIAHFSKKDSEDIYLQGLEKQPSHKNKTLILDFFIDQLKNNIKPTLAMTEKVLPKMLVYFDIYTKEKEELFLSIFKIIPTLVYTGSGELKNIKKKIIGFKRQFENRLSTQFKNNLGEFAVKLNQLAARFEESENKVKNVVVLFDIDKHKIDHDRMLKLKDQLKDIDVLDDDSITKLGEFLVEMYEVAKLDWKIRSVAVELLGDYGTLKELPKLTDFLSTESSLAVKVNGQKALKKLEERNAEDIHPVLIIEPLPFLQKKLNEFFKSQAFQVFNLDDIKKLHDVTQKFFKFLVITDTVFKPEVTPFIMEYLDENLDTILIIVCGKPEEMDIFQGLENVRFLKKPFNNDTLMETIS